MDGWHMADYGINLLVPLRSTRLVVLECK